MFEIFLALYKSFKFCLSVIVPVTLQLDKVRVHLSIIVWYSIFYKWVLIFNFSYILQLPYIELQIANEVFVHSGIDSLSIRNPMRIWALWWQSSPLGARFSRLSLYELSAAHLQNGCLLYLFTTHILDTETKVSWTWLFGAALVKNLLPVIFSQRSIYSKLFGLLKLLVSFVLSQLLFNLLVTSYFIGWSWVVSALWLKSHYFRQITSSWRFLSSLQLIRSTLP